MSRFRCVKNRCHALTLIELVVVLGILAVLSTVAVRSLEPIADQARYEVTQRILDNLQAATIAGGEASSIANTAAISGFTVDCGVLPTDVDDLMVKPPAIVSNALQSFDSDRDATNDVSLRSGWNGPYLQLGAGLTDAVDGWGAAPIFTVNSGTLEIASLGSDGDSIVPEDGYRKDITVTVASRDYLGEVVMRLYSIDSNNGSRIDPNPVGTEQLGVLFYGVNADGGTDGSVEEQLLIVSNAGSFERRRSSTLCGTIAARAIQWNDLDSDDVLDVGEAITRKSIVHYGVVRPSIETRIEMELR